MGEKFSVIPFKTLFFLLLFQVSSFAQVVSMSPAITETLHFLKVQKKLVGISQFCDDRGAGLPRLGTPFTPSYEKIVKLKPKIILSQPIKGSKFYNFAKKLNLQVKEYPFNGIDDIESSIIKLGTEFKSDRGSHFKTLLNKNRKILEKKAIEGSFYAVLDLKGSLDQFKGFVIGAEDSYLSDVIEFTGLKNIAPFKKGYKEISAETFLKSDVDYLIFFNRSPELKPGAIRDLLRKKLKMKKLPQVIVFNKKYTVIPGPDVLKLMEDVANVL